VNRCKFVSTFQDYRDAAAAGPQYRVRADHAQRELR